MPVIVKVDETSYNRIVQWVRPPEVTTLKYSHWQGEEFTRDANGGMRPSQDFKEQKFALPGDRLLVVEWVHEDRPSDTEHLMYICRTQEARDMLYNALLAVMDLSTSQVRTDW